MTHLSDDRTVAKMGHPVVVVLSDGVSGKFPPLERVDREDSTIGAMREDLT
jgi:hypothetical protein